ELVDATTDPQRALVRDQFAAKLQRAARHLDGDALADLEHIGGLPPRAFVAKLRSLPFAELAQWFVANAALGEILDRRRQGSGAAVLVSHHADELVGIERGYGKGTKPEDYLEAFRSYIQTHKNEI